VVSLPFAAIADREVKGGLNTKMKPLLDNLPLSALVAGTGILVPIALSFTLGPVSGATPLQCFAAGAALSATSLGTTFTILSAAGFADTRLGAVLTNAAMTDDVVGLVMIQIVASLGSGGGEVNGEAVGRPVGASVGLLVAVLVGCWGAKKVAGGRNVEWEVLAGKRGKFVLQTGLLVGLVVVASYAGASVLFAAFLAGTILGWWDGRKESGCGEREERERRRWASAEVYEAYYQPIVRRVLAPFFFVSI
jgi:Kef-type K+ transport system membrane component KefB